MSTESDLHTWQQRLRGAASRSSAEFDPPALAAKPRCANPSCRRRWFGLLKDHRRPIFEDRWACSGHCLRVAVEAAIRRESPASSVSEYQHNNRVPVGLILLTRGWVTQFQLQHALGMQRHSGGGLLGRWLVEECGIAEERILQALALQWRCNVYTLHSCQPQQMALAMPHDLVERISALPLRISSRGTLRLAFTDRPNPATAYALQRMTGREVESGLLSHADWKSAQQELFRCEPVRCSFERLIDRETLVRRIASDIAGMAPRASRLVRIRELFWLRMWLEDSAAETSRGRVAASRNDMLDRIYSADALQAA